MDGVPIHLQSYSNMVLGLNGTLTRAKGSIKLTVEADEAPQRTKLNIELAYNAITGQPLLFSLRATVFLYHYSLKFTTPHRVGEIKDNKDLAKKCQMKIHPTSQNTRTLPGVHMACPLKTDLKPLDPRSRIKGGKLVEELDKILFCDSDPLNELKVGHKL